MDDYAQAKGVTFVNHTFTSHLALCASMQAYAGQPPADPEGVVLCEYPTELKPVAFELTQEHLMRDADGLIRLPETPGLGITPDREAVSKYLVDVEMRAKGRVLYRTPSI